MRARYSSQTELHRIARRAFSELWPFADENSYARDSFLFFIIMSVSSIFRQILYILHSRDKNTTQHFIHLCTFCLIILYKSFENCWQNLPSFDQFKNFRENDYSWRFVNRLIWAILNPSDMEISCKFWVLCFNKIRVS